MRLCGRLQLTAVALALHAGGHLFATPSVTPQRAQRGALSRHRGVPTAVDAVSARAASRSGQTEERQGSKTLGRWLCGFAAAFLAPAAAMAKPTAFSLFGFSSAQLFPIQSLSLLSWSAMLLLPRWRRTRHVALVGPVVHAMLYLVIIVHMLSAPGVAVDFGSLAGIMAGFSVPDGVFAGWLHYCVFDPLVGLAQLLDSQRIGVPHLLMVPVLLATMFLGPIGFLAYIVLRSAALILKRRDGDLRSYVLSRR